MLNQFATNSGTFLFIDTTHVFFQYLCKDNNKAKVAYKERKSQHNMNTQSNPMTSNQQWWPSLNLFCFSLLFFFFCDCFQIMFVCSWCPPRATLFTLSMLDIHLNLSLNLIPYLISLFVILLYSHKLLFQSRTIIPNTKYDITNHALSHCLYLLFICFLFPK